MVCCLLLTGAIQWRAPTIWVTKVSHVGTEVVAVHMKLGQCLGASAVLFSFVLTLRIDGLCFILTTMALPMWIVVASAC